MSNNLTAVSLFAGVGGFDLALERAGVKVIASVEIDKKASSILARHFPNSKLFSDVKEVTGEQLISAGFIPERGIITGGFPCQDVSVAGKRAGLTGVRTGLFWEIIRLLKETQAQYFILENVPGLLSSNEGRDMGTVLGALAECGYGVAYRVLDAQHFGVPQRRRRVFIVGCLGEGGASPSEILAIAQGRAGYLEASKQKGKTVAGKTPKSVRNGDPVGSLTASDCKGAGNQYVAENKLVIQPQLSNGHAIANCLPAELYHRGTVVNQDVNAGHLVIQDSFVKSRRAQSIDDDETWIDGKVSTTLNAFDNGGESRATVLVVNQVVRRLTPTECERLQGFEDGWTDEQADSNRYKQMGNAVAVPVVEWIVNRLVDLDEH
jgi:DNA (cytosine-5)-methyltransferase 1